MSESRKKAESVISLNDRDRYDYFVRKVADFEVAWGLGGDGWATAKLNGSVVVPFWPEAMFAELSATGEWSGFRPKQIRLDEFLSNWLPGMQRDGILCLVFPAPSGAGSIVHPQQLIESIVKELEQYE